MINNKGFAISTMLYGLLIILVLTVSVILGTLAFTRKNSKEFSDEIKEELENKHIETPGEDIEVRNFSLSSNNYFKPCGQYTCFIVQRYNPYSNVITGSTDTITVNVRVCSNSEIYASNDKLYAKITNKNNPYVELRFNFVLSNPTNDESSENCKIYSGNLAIDDGIDTNITSTIFSDFSNNDVMKVEIEFGERHFYDAKANYNGYIKKNNEYTVKNAYNQNNEYGNNNSTY